MGKNKCKKAIICGGLLALLALNVLVLMWCFGSSEEDASGESDRQTSAEANETGTEGEQPKSVDNVYQIERLEFEIPVTDIRKLAANGEMLCLYGFVDAGNVESADSLIDAGDAEGTDSHDAQEVIFACNLGDQGTKTIDLKIVKANIGLNTDTVNLAGMDIAEDGSLVAVFSERSTELPDVNQYQVVMFDPEGILLWHELIPKDASFVSPTYYENRIYIPVQDTLFVYSMTGELLDRYTFGILPTTAGAVNMDIGIKGLYILENGDAFAFFQEESLVPDRILIEIDLETGELGERVERISSNTDLLADNWYGYDFIMIDAYGIYGRWRDAADNVKMTRLVDFKTSDLQGEYLDEIIPLEKEKYLAIYRDPEGSDEVCYLVKVELEEWREK